ncbi:MAG TPA: hypothetical protein VIG91_00215 [Terriglobales bacterium]|jgi:hypothetical protein
MRDTKPVKETPNPQTFAINSPEKSAESKKQRHQRRKAIRLQNSRSKVK